jgi:hypothetical protein
VNFSRAFRNDSLASPVVRVEETDSLLRVSMMYRFSGLERWGTVILPCS